MASAHCGTLRRVLEQCGISSHFNAGAASGRPARRENLHGMMASTAAEGLIAG